MSMILINIIFAWHRSIDWYRDVLPDVPLTVFRMNNTIFQRACFGTDEPKNRGTFLRFPDMPTAQLTWWCPDNYRPLKRRGRNLPLKPLEQSLHLRMIREPIHRHRKCI